MAAFLCTALRIILLLGLCAVVVNCDADKKKQNGKGKPKKVTFAEVKRRLFAVEKELADAKEDLASTREEVQKLTAKVHTLEQQGGGTGGGGGAPPAPTRLAQLPPCPGVEGFRYAEETSSCYHLQPSAVLQNFTEATDTCKSLHPKSHIVVIDGPKEHEFLKNIWYHERGISSISRFWINLEKEEGRNLWKWADSGRRLMYSHWIPTTTHSDDRFACAAVYSNEAYYWGDVACWGPHMVTCEVDQ